MLCQFTFKNFKSYRDETTLDMQAANISEFADSLLRSEGDGKAFLPVAALYGPNGGGKSNALEALNVLLYLIRWPVFMQAPEAARNAPSAASYQPFLFDWKSAGKPTEFEVYFRTEKQEFRYRIALLEKSIEGESLHRRAVGGKRTALLFKRDADGITLGPSLIKEKLNVNVNPAMPYLSFLSFTYNLDVIKDAMSFFATIIGESPEMIEYNWILLKNQNINREFTRLLQTMGIDIDEILIKDEEKKIFTLRHTPGGRFGLPLDLESDGTKRLFQLLPNIIMILSMGGLAAVDELDARLHPKLLRYIIQMFVNPEINTKGAQLVFTSHDLSTMKNDLFRRDEIWFAAKNKEEVSELYSLYDIRTESGERVKSTAAFDKQYLAGRYGADPYLKEMMEGPWSGEAKT